MVRGIWLLAASCASGITLAATVELEAEAGLGRSDNFTRTEVLQQDATLRMVGLRFSVLQDSRRMDADLVGDLSLTDYSGSRYSSDLTGSIAGRVSLALIEDHLRWTVEDSFGQARRDPFSVPAVENREQVNYFSTGPDLRFGLGGRATNLLLAGRYTRVDHEFTPSDSYRFGAQAAVERDLSDVARIALYAGIENVEPQGDNPGSDHDRAAIFLRYVITGARASLEIDAGGNRLRGGGMRESGALLRIGLARRIGRMSRLTLSAGQEFSDAGAVMRPPSSGPLPPPTHNTESLLQTTEPFTLRHVEAGWTITGRRTALRFSLRGSEENYELASLPDRKRGELGFGAVRQMGRRTEASIDAVVSTTDFAPSGADFDETTLRAALLWQLGRRTRVEISGERYEFSPDLSASVDEMRYWVRLRFGDRLFRAIAP